MEVTNVSELETTELRSGASDEVVWVGGFFAYGGDGAEQSATIYFAVPPGDRLGKHVDTAEDTESPWVTLVWDDPVNLMTYVTYVFQKLFGYSEPHATKLMLQVHNEGKAVVSAGSRESMEVDVSKLHAAGLWATMQHDR